MSCFQHRGTVYGTLLNHCDALAALGGTVNEPPYKAPPKAPILYIKPRNTWIDGGEAIVVPTGVDELEIGATLGLVIGNSACRVSEDHAMGVVAGYSIVNDVSVPHDTYYRPSLRYKARDTFCPIGPFIARDTIGSPDGLDIVVRIDGEIVQRASTAALIRSAARLIADVSDFMTLTPGDVLSVGVAARAPRARAGQSVSISITGLGRLDNPLVAESALT
jgi:5-oxopent-3-ene-1,2,5-tricarboxylate decarboxylase / 2-hydroxyhepta-2,4-diene-1,7-dioate isomerase